MRSRPQVLSIEAGSGGLTDGDKGDVTVASSGNSLTVDNDAITLAKIAPGTAGKFIGFDGSGDPAELDASSTVTETLTVASQNTINNLSQTPTGVAVFYVNGERIQGTGITNAGQSITVNPAILGFNVAITDDVQTQYPV